MGDISVKHSLEGLFVSLLLPFLILVSDSSHGQEAKTGWKALDLKDWKGKSSNGNGYDLGTGWATHSLPLGLVEGKWVRVIGSADANSPDFMILISVFNEQSRAINRSLPTLCETVGNRKMCSGASWIRPGGATAKVTLYSNYLPVTVVLEKAEVAVESQVRQVNVSRFEAITSDMARLYFRTSEVDWPLIKSKVEMALQSPEDIDPIPYAVLQLLSHLPDSKHSAVYRTEGRVTGEPLLPLCKKLQSGGVSTWRLDLPGTPSREQDNALYIQAANTCLARPGVRRWVINLTENSGGDAIVMFAALSQLFKAGPLMEFQNTSGGRFVVAKSSEGISINGKLNQRVKTTHRPFQGKVLVAVSKACASSCEAVAIAMKGQHQVVGTSTAGLATANESLPLNSRFSLAITSGYMADAKGKIYSIVVPDLAVSDEVIARIIQKGTFRHE